MLTDERQGAEMAATGTRVLGGRYVLGEVLGTGGMATVWRARDEVLGRDVAVKVLSPQYAADPGFLARFEREARHAARLSHPHLVTVFDCGVDESMPFIVMELVAGPTLRQVLDRAGTLPAGEAVSIAAAVCEALEVAHAAGLVHRDIKPANIVLAGGGEVKVLDFGIARADGGAGSTRTQGVLGTAAYLSPEQASGHPAGPQSDLYALGCVLFEMLTGAPPFSADTTVGIAYRHVHDDPGLPSGRRPGLPERLDQITGRLLAKNPQDRPATAAAARAGLLAALSQDATARLTPLTGEPARISRGRWRPRVTEVVLAAGLVAALAALAGVLLTGGTAKPKPAGAAAPATTHPAVTSNARNAVGTHHKKAGKPATRKRASALPPAAAAAAALVGDLQAAVSDGQVTQQAGQDLFNHLQQLLFGPPGQNTQQIQQQYQQLLQSYDQHQSQGQITGPAARTLRRDLQTLGAAVGAT
jgi:eukaryotic-like serine/threonine-protein kinase